MGDKPGCPGPGFFLFQDRQRERGDNLEYLEYLDKVIKIVKIFKIIKVFKIVIIIPYLNDLFLD